LIIKHDSTFYLSRDAARKGRKCTSFALVNKAREEMARRACSSLLHPHRQYPCSLEPTQSGDKY